MDLCFPKKFPKAVWVLGMDWHHHSFGKSVPQCLKVLNRSMTGGVAFDDLDSDFTEPIQE